MQVHCVDGQHPNELLAFELELGHPGDVLLGHGNRIISSTADQ